MSRLFSLIAHLSIVVTALSLSACSGGDPTGPAALATIEVAGATRAIAALGETLPLTAAGKSAKGKAVAGLTFTWTSSDPRVATVSDGIVTAVGNGTTSITASAGSSTGSAQVTVQQVATQMVVTFTRDTIAALGDTSRALATTRDARGSAIGAVTPTWSSSNPGVATVTASGQLTGVSEGTTIIRGVADALQGERMVTVQQRAARLVLTRQPSGARAGVALEVQPIAEVQDSRGNRVTTDNATVVSASVGSGAGTISGSGVAASSGGVVTFTSLGVGGVVGVKSLQLAATGLETVTSNSFTLAAGLPVAVAIVGGNSQTGLAGVALSQPLQAGLRDGFGNGVPSVPIAFSVQTGGGTLSVDVVTTDASGNASTTYTLSRFAGASTVRATSAAAPAAQATFVATATPNGVIRGSVTGSAMVPGVLSTSGGALRNSTTQTHRILRDTPILSLPQFADHKTTRGVLPVASARMTSAAQVGGSDTRQTDDADAHVPNELLVVYRAEALDAPSITASAFRWRDVAPAVAQTIREAVLEVIAPSVHETVASVLSVSPTLLTARIRLASGAREADVIAELRRDPRVAVVERNGLMHSHRVRPTALELYLASRGVGHAVPVGSLLEIASPFRDASAQSSYPFGGLFPGNALFRRQAWHYNLVSLPQAWMMTQGSSDVVVAVIDDGIRFDHPSMAGVLTDDGYDFVSAGSFPRCSGGTVSLNGDGDGYDGNPTIPMDYDVTSGCVTGINSSGGHGLHVAGTIGAARTTATGLVGVNWNVRIRPVRALGTTGSGSSYDISQAVLYAAGLPADNGFGGTVSAPGGRARIINMSLGGTVFNTTQANAVAAAVANGVLIIASSGNNNNSLPNYPGSYPDVISVSSVAPTLNRASYSSFGPSVDITAPGGQGIKGSSTNVLSSTWNFVTTQPTFDSWQGTSMSTPHVAGIAALVMAREPGLSAAQVAARLLGTALDIGAPGRDHEFGAGLVNARNAVSGTLAPQRIMYVRVVNSMTGLVVRTVPTANNGTYEVNGLADGAYWVYAGHDESNDGFTGLPWRTWGALGAASNPSTVLVNGAGVYPATFSITTGAEIEPNDSPSAADELLVDGYSYGTIFTISDVDMYRLRVGVQGTYVLQATGQVGACGYANEADPILTVFSGAGTRLAEQDDIDAANDNYCSRLTLPLSVGDYYVRVGGFSTGRYALVARRQ